MGDDLGQPCELSVQTTRQSVVALVNNFALCTIHCCMVWWWSSVEIHKNMTATHEEGGG